jgi:oligosaccharide repeat unit polymerase
LWCIVFLNWLLYKDVLYPGFLQALLWTLLITYMLFSYEHFRPLHFNTLIIIFAGVFTFSMGTFLANFKHVPIKSNIEINTNALSGKLFTNLLFIVSLTGLPFFLWKVYEVGSNGPHSSFFGNLSVGNTNGALVSYSIFMWISFVNVGMHMLKLISLTKGDNLYGRAKLLTFLSICIALLYALMFTGRNFIMSLSFIIIGILLVARKIKPIKTAFVFVIFGFAIFIIYALVLNKGLNANEDIATNIEMFNYQTRLYLLGSIPALDLLVNNLSDFDLGKNTFRTFILRLNDVGMDYEIPPLVKEFVFIPYPTNIYTMYQPYYTDFGLLGPIIFQFIFGLWHGFLYRQSTKRNPSPLYIFLFCLFLDPLFFQYNTDAYFTLMSKWIIYFIILMIGFGFMKKNLDLKKDMY